MGTQSLQSQVAVAFDAYALEYNGFPSMHTKFNYDFFIMDKYIFLNTGFGY